MAIRDTPEQGVQKLLSDHHSLLNLWTSNTQTFRAESDFLALTYVLLNTYWDAGRFSEEARRGTSKPEGSIREQ